MAVVLYSISQQSSCCTHDFELQHSCKVFVDISSFISLAKKAALCCCLVTELRTQHHSSQHHSFQHFDVLILS